MRAQVPFEWDSLRKIMTDGFVLIKAQREVQLALQGAFDAGLKFFNKSQNEKMASRLPRDSGYRPYGIEYSQSPIRPDKVESFTVSHRTASPAPLLPEANSLYEKMLCLFDICESIVEKFSIQLANMLADRDYRSELSGALHFSSILQLNYSRPTEIATGYINDIHDDGCLLTLTSVTGPGLELELSDGSFMPMDPAGESLLLMAGEILWLLSGGNVRPVRHRVRPIRSYNERMSLLFFADLHPKKCRPWIINEINEGVDIAARVLANAGRFGLSEWQLEDF